MLLSALALATEPAPAPESIAVDLWYTYFQVAYALVDVDGVSDDADSFELSGVYALDHKIYLFGGLRYSMLDGPEGNLDTTAFEFGGGMHAPAGPRTDGIFEIALLRAEVNDGDNNDGWSLAIGLRHRLNDTIELDGKLKQVYLDEDDTRLEAGARFYVTERASLGIELIGGDHTESVGLSLRLDT